MHAYIGALVDSPWIALTLLRMPACPPAAPACCAASNHGSATAAGPASVTTPTACARSSTPTGARFAHPSPGALHAYIDIYYIYHASIHAGRRRPNVAAVPAAAGTGRRLAMQLEVSFLSLISHGHGARYDSISAYAPRAGACRGGRTRTAARTWSCRHTTSRPRRRCQCSSSSIRSVCMHLHSALLLLVCYSIYILSHLILDFFLLLLAVVGFPRFTSSSSN